jgi:hypothetical protein
LHAHARFSALFRAQAGGMFGGMGNLMEQARPACRSATLHARQTLTTPRRATRALCPQVKKAQQVVQVEAVRVQKELAACVPACALSCGLKPADTHRRRCPLTPACC